MIHSESLKNLVPALVKAQSEMGKAVKGAENPFFKSDYADLPAVMEVVKDPLNNNGLVAVQSVDVEVVRTIIMHISGEYIGSEGTKIANEKPNNAQSQGSAITYAKRYDLQALLFVPTTDDDGEKAVVREPVRTERPKPTPDAGWRNNKPTENQLAFVDKRLRALGHKVAPELFSTLKAGEVSDFLGNKISEEALLLRMGLEG